MNQLSITDDEIVKRLKRGSTYRKLSEELNTSENTLRYRAQKLGYKHKSRVVTSVMPGVISKETYCFKILSLKEPPNWVSPNIKRSIRRWGLIFRENHRPLFNDSYTHYLKTKEVTIKGQILNDRIWA